MRNHGGRDDRQAEILRALRAVAAVWRGGDVSSTMKEFPIISQWQWERGLPKALVNSVPKRVPFDLVAGHEAQAMKNHGQTLAELAGRGGLSPAELYCVVNDKAFYRRDSGEVEVAETAAARWLIDQMILAQP